MEKLGDQRNLYLGDDFRVWNDHLSGTLGISYHGNVKLSFNPFTDKPWFVCVCSSSLLKTQWKKETLPERANSPFPTVFSYHLENFQRFSANLKLSSANSSSLVESKLCRFYQTIPGFYYPEEEGF